MDRWEGYHHRHSAWGSVPQGIGKRRETLRLRKSHLMEVVTGQVDSVGKEMGVFTDCFIRKLGCRVLGRSP